jgi:branched-chain amino acid transport system ATP-binding protein
LCPEGRRVFPELSIEANLRLGAWSRRRESGAFEKTKELVYEYFPVLSDRSAQAAGTLSGGEQQMLAIGRAMMSEPKLLLVDEASLGLSPLLAQTVFRAVNRINKSGTTVIIVEQNVGVLPYADKVLILEKGTLVFSGRGKDVSGADLRAQYLGGTASRDGKKAKPTSKAKPARKRKAKARR